MKKILVLISLFVSMAISAQVAEPEAIGSLSMSAYPKLKMPVGKKLYALVENGTLAEDGTFTATVAQLNNESFIRTGNPAEADFLIRYSQFNAVTPMAIDRFNPMKRNTKIKVGTFWVPTRTDPPGSSQMKPGQIPMQMNSSTKYYCAYMHLAFDFHVAITLPDKSSIYVEDVKCAKDYNSGWQPREGMAVEKVQESASAMSFESVVGEYNTKKIRSLVGASRLLANKDLVCYTVKSKKRSSNNSEYIEINDAVNKLKGAVNILKDDEWNIDAFKMETSGCEETWLAEADSIDDVRITKETSSAIHYDLGIYYMLCREFGKAAAQFKAVEVVDKKLFADADKWAKDCEKWQKEKDAYEAMMKENKK